eukprot:IDg8082t1
MRAVTNPSASRCLHANDTLTSSHSTMAGRYEKNFRSTPSIEGLSAAPSQSRPARPTPPPQTRCRLRTAPALRPPWRRRACGRCTRPRRKRGGHAGDEQPVAAVPQTRARVAQQRAGQDLAGQHGGQRGEQQHIGRGVAKIVRCGRREAHDVRQCEELATAERQHAGAER